MLTPGTQCDHMVGRPQILLNRGADQECHQKSTDTCSSPTVTRAQRGNNRKHHPVRMRGGQPSAQSWWRMGAGFTTSTTLSACLGQAPGRASPPGPADSGLQGSPPSSRISTRWAAPGAHTAFPALSAHTLQQTGRGPRGTFNTCQELPAGADPGHPTHCLTSDRALRSLAQPSPQGLKRMKPASEVRRVRAEATLPRWHCWQDPHG